jgi:hypothetical protein
VIELEKILGSLVETAKLGGWGVSIIMVYFTFKDKKDEREALIKTLQGVTEALTKVSVTVEQTGRITEKSMEVIERNNSLLMQLCAK